MTYMIEGEWSGYTSAQRRVCHRHYTTNKKEVASIEAIGHAIRFMDGTCLVLDIKEVKGRKRLPVINGYNSLIQDCRWAGVNSVDALAEARKAKAAV